MHQLIYYLSQTPQSMSSAGAAFSKVPRKILGKLLILLQLLLLLLLLLHSFLLLRWTELIGLLVQCSTVALYSLDDVATCVSVAPKIRSFPKMFLGTLENVAPDIYADGVLLHTNVQKVRDFFTNVERYEKRLTTTTTTTTILRPPELCPGLPGWAGTRKVKPGR